MRRLTLALAALLLSATAAAAAPLRIAAVTGSAGACATLGASAPAGLKAYYRHLADRMQVEVQQCPFATRAAAAQALAAGRVDLAVLDPAAFAPVRQTVRAILTVRRKGAINRIPVVLAAARSSNRQGLAGARGASIVFGGSFPAAYAVPKKALADAGAGEGFFGRETVTRDEEAAIAALRAGQVQTMAVHAGAWQRLCRGDKPGEDKCADLAVLWRGRPQAELAVVVRRDMPAPDRFRLIGIHVAMHLEAPQAFQAGSAFIADGVEFEPTEADALLAGAIP